ncbi:hypothetical protein SH601_05030 [Gracilibacillus sp. S3-1-1]|uniref:Uncharacterized protein n=1 Tax=Gracilibacillus pellucidus TaxID=3095368 RepID=A0ACC6M3C3_9BACI|nr:hypothetical protein [Gracilibacillus sp. S3-1-1]MDX8045347.1 hypothetical protein [Gracilibacillus sp. S3-1-1]
MFIKRIVIVAGLFLLVACSQNQQANSEVTLAEMNTESTENASGEVVNEESNSESVEVEEEEATTQQEEPKEEKVNQPEPKQSGDENIITWDDFFDDDQQETPSEKFWDLSGEEVVIDGFMGEVLSLAGGWFLLIPEPGAECPFDNGDQSYWNKIMIVFVDDKQDLRFTNGPLKVTGRLDVGVKVDESNYRTMFRLYDAQFEVVKQ